MKKQRTTVADVAALAGVSPMTVSRALTKQNLVKQETRDKVEAAVRQLNYRPNVMARGLAGGTGLFIGLIYTNPSYGYLSEMLRGVLDACRERGHFLIVDKPFGSDEMVDPAHIDKRFIGTNMQAVIVVPPLSSDERLFEALDQNNIVSVAISPRQPTYDGLAVSMDDEAAVTEMTEYLIGLGHKRIGFIKGQEGHLASNRRFRAFCETVEKHGLPLDEELIGQGSFTYRTGMEAAKSMLEHAHCPTAIFASNDDMAAGAIAAAHQAGLHVPSDISIVGFDDTENARQIWPPLTTIRQPIREMAAQAVTFLEQRLEYETPDEPFAVLQHELVIRDSATGPRS